MSSSLATAQHLKKVELLLDDSDINFLRSCLLSLSHSQSLQELDVYCTASGEFWVSFSECCGLCWRGTLVVHCLSCLCSGAGEVLADSVLALRSVKKLCIRDINPVPVLHSLSQNVEHCAVSTLVIAFLYHPELVRSVSMGPCSTSQPAPIKAHLFTPCVHCCTQAHVAYLFVVHFYPTLRGRK